MYHILDNEDAQHITRVYYIPEEESTNVMEYKDLIMRGTTWIDWFNLEHTSILYSRQVYKKVIYGLQQLIFMQQRSRHLSFSNRTTSCKSPPSSTFNQYPIGQDDTW